MNKALLKAFALTISLSLVVGVSCSKPSSSDSGGGPVQTEKIVVPSSVTLNPVVASESKNTTIPFTAAEPWTASVTTTKADSWIDINPKSGGAGSASITITATVNDSYESRMATIVIVCGGDTVTIVFTQEGKKKEPEKVSGVTLDKSSLTLTEGESYKLTATVSPSNAEDRSVSWSSDNTAIATVDVNGNVKAVKAGTAVITVKTTDEGKTATCTVTVREKEKNGDIEDVGFENW